MINSKYVHSSLAPWYLYAGVNAYCKSDVTAVVNEGTINESPDAVIDRLISENADLYGFCCYIWNIEYVLSAAKVIKEKTNALIVLGGPEVSYNAQEILEKHSFADFVLSGEGEKSFPLLCDALATGRTDLSVPGLCKRENGRVVISPPAVSEAEPLSPYCEEYFSSLNGRIAYIESSRGCPYSCAFCLSGRCGKLVEFSMDRVKSEILALAPSSARTIKFIDRTFNAKEHRANEIISFILENYGKGIPENVCFHFEIDGGTLRDSTIELLKKAPAGLFQLEAGLQSFNPDTLRAVHRNPDTSRLESVIETLVGMGNVHIHADLIAGLPHEDYTSFRNNFNRLYSYRPHMLQLGFLKLIHGSELRDTQFCEYGKKAPYEVISTPVMTSSDLEKIHMAEDALDRLYNSGRFPHTLTYLTETCNIEPYELFEDFGFFTKEKRNIPLDEYITLVYNFFGTKTDKATLRDMLVCDRLATNSSGILPDCLKIEDKRLKKLKKFLAENKKLKGRFSAAILYSQNKAVFCDYKKKNPVTEKYNLSFMELENI